MTRSGEPYRVGLVVDPVFGDKLLPLAARMHVWVIRTPVNQEAVETVWREDRSMHDLERGATIFDADAKSSLSETVASMLDVIDLHHGELSHSPPYSVLEVYGAGPDPLLTAVFVQRGFSNLVSTPGGFAATRAIAHEK
jgi:hypothetical protein